MPSHVTRRVRFAAAAVGSVRCTLVAFDHHSQIMSNDLVAELTHLRTQILSLKDARAFSVLRTARVLLGSLARGLWLCQFVVDSARKLHDSCQSMEDSNPLNDKENEYLEKTAGRGQRIQEGFMMIITGLIRFVSQDSVPHSPMLMDPILGRHCMKLPCRIGRPK